MQPKTIYHTSISMNQKDIDKRNKLKSYSLIDILRRGMDSLLTEKDGVYIDLKEK